MSGLEEAMSSFNLEQSLASMGLGGVIGGVAMRFLDLWLETRKENAIARQALVDKYLLQLQDAIEDLLERLNAPIPEKPLEGEAKIYHDSTMLYALGRIFAFKRILVSDAVYTQMRYINKTLGNHVKKTLDDIDDLLKTIDLKADGSKELFTYDNIALGELVVERQTDHLETISYREFKKRYDDETEPIRKNLDRIRGIVDDLQDPDAKEPIDELKTILGDLAELCKVSTKIKNRPQSKTEKFKKIRIRK